LYKDVFTEKDRVHLIENIAKSLGQTRPEVRELMLKVFYRVDPDYGERVAKAIGMTIPKSFMEKPELEMVHTKC